MNKIIFGGCLIVLFCSLVNQAAQKDSLVSSCSFTAATQGAVEISLPLMAAQYHSTLPHSNSSTQFLPRLASNGSDVFRKGSSDSDISARDTDTEDSYSEDKLFPSTPHDSPAGAASQRTLAAAVVFLQTPISKAVKVIPGLTDEERQKLQSQLLTNTVASLLIAQKKQHVAPVLPTEHEDVELTNTIDKELGKKWWCCSSCS